MSRISLFLILVVIPLVFLSASSQEDKSRPFAGVRPYGDKAPWNIPVADIPIHPNSDYYVNELWNEFPKGVPGTSGYPNTPEFNYRNYTFPVYNAQEATEEYTVHPTRPWGNLHGQKIPFHPSWKPAMGTDAQIIILDPISGVEWNMINVDIDHEAKTVAVENGNRCAGDYWTNNWDDPATQTSGSRGVGINYLAMLVRPWEIEQGVIEHALSMPIKSTSGTEYFPPATKLEHPGKEGNIPEGARFSLDVTYLEIDEHVNAIEGASPGLRKGVRALLVAMKDYGWFITDTAGGQSLHLEAWESAQDEWKRLGFTELFGVSHRLYGRTLQHPRFSLYGFLTKDRIRLHVPSDQYPQ